MNTNPYKSPASAAQEPKRNSGWFMPRFLEVLFVIAVIGVLIALLLPARRSVSEASRRTVCGNNLYHIGLALRTYEKVYHCLPPAYTVDGEGKPLHSWRTLLLPFLEARSLYKKIDLAKPWDDPSNQAAFESMPVAIYRCPSDDGPANHTTYLAVAAPGGCFQRTEHRDLAEITDDHDCTLMLIDIDLEHAVPWMSPMDADEELILDIRSAARLPHPGGAQALLVSGRSRFLSARISAETLRALISIDGNDDAIAQEDP